ncbi:glycosyltransferase [Flavobacterium sp. 3-218]
MVERKEISLLYQYNDNWIGGTYYIINIIKALNVLVDVEKPHLVIFHNSEESTQLIKSLNYPYIEFQYFGYNFNIFERIINKVGRIILGRDFIKNRIGDKRIKNLYPINSSIDTSNIDEFFFWIPDFQEWYLPDFFSKKEIQYRKDSQKYLVDKKYPIVFSSNNALEDFNKFYPNNKNRKEVLRFVSIVDNIYSNIEISELKKKYSIKDDYFIVPNQFWKHKNHKVILEAAKVIKERGDKFLVVFTGKEYDYRNPDYTLSLKREIKENGLEDNFCFLGFIDRAEQLQLMKNSIAIIQPSLFEGWSTVVEDTKAINHVIILSDLPLHREQIKDNCIFFNPLDGIELADKLIFAMDNNFRTTNFDMAKNQLDFANKIISIFN